MTICKNCGHKLAYFLGKFEHIRGVETLDRDSQGNFRKISHFVICGCTNPEPFTK